jgi:gliding motility-associated-like protein
MDSLQVLTGTYNVEVTDNKGCRGKSPAFPVWEVDPHPVISGVTAVCGQQSAQLITTHPYQSYAWIDSVTTNTLSTNDTLTVGTGTFTVTVTDSMGCTGTSPAITIAIHQFPNALFSYSPSNVLAGDTIHFTDLSTAGSGHITEWHWEFGDGATSVQQNPSHAFAVVDSHVVSLTVTQSDGCTDTYRFTIEPTEVLAYNIITPNHDKANDAFVFLHLEFYPNSKLEVFNRWGKKVYENSNYQNDWEGGDLSDGVYYYIMKIPNKPVMKGTLTIIR